MKKTNKKASKKARYHYTECGLDYIFLRNGFETIPSPRGQRVHIHNVEGLHRAIGEMLVSEKKHLDGKEFRFLRHELNMTQQNLASLLGIDVQALARWEKEKTKVIPGPAQRVIRLLYSEKMGGNQEICLPLQRLAELDEMIPEEPEIDFRQDNEEWQPYKAFRSSGRCPKKAWTLDSGHDIFPHRQHDRERTESVPMGPRPSPTHGITGSGLETIGRHICRR
jgi:putative transcriptional regulator